MVVTLNLQIEMVVSPKGMKVLICGIQLKNRGASSQNAMSFLSLSGFSARHFHATIQTARGVCGPTSKSHRPEKNKVATGQPSLMKKKATKRSRRGPREERARACETCGVKGADHGME
jgi:hypothetical protein